MKPAALLDRGGEHLGQPGPEAQRPVADGQGRGAHAAAGAVAQQVSPGLGRFAVAIGQGDELLAAVGTHADEHQQAQFRLVEADGDVDAVGPHVDVVHTGQIALGEGAVFCLPLLGELGDHRRRQALRRAQELAQRGHEIARRQAVQIRPPAAPR